MTAPLRPFGYARVWYNSLQESQITAAAVVRAPSGQAQPARRFSVGDLTTISKVCSKCKEEKPPAEFAACKRTRDGLWPSCRECERERKRAAYAADPSRQREAERRWRAKNPEKVRENARSWREENADKERERHRLSRLSNPEMHREKVRRSYRKHAEERKAASAAYYRDNREHERRKAAEHRVALGDAALLRERETRARIRARRASVPYVRVDYRTILDRDGYVCGICGQPIEPQSLDAVEFDHIVPIERGGAHLPENITVSHLSCNKRKWNKLLEELR